MRRCGDAVAAQVTAPGLEHDARAWQDEARSVPDSIR